MPGSCHLPIHQNNRWRDGAGSRDFLTLKSHHSHTAHAAQHPFPSVATLSRAGGAARPGNSFSARGGSFPRPLSTSPRGHDVRAYEAASAIIVRYAR